MKEKTDIQKKTDLDEVSSLKNRYTDEQIIEAMANSGGITSKVCQILDCKQWEFQVLLTQDKELGKRWQNIRRYIVAAAERTMVELMEPTYDEKTRFAAAKFLLQSLGQKDGYGASPQVAVEVNNGDGEGNMSRIRAIFGL